MAKAALVMLPFLFSCTDNLPEKEECGELPEKLARKIAGRSEGDFEQGQLLVLVDVDMMEKWEAGDSISVADGVRGKLGLTGFRPALTAKPKNMSLARELGLDRWFVAEFDRLAPLVEAAGEIASSPHVEAVQFNNRCHAIPSGTSEKCVELGTKSVTPVFWDDPLFNSQWNLYNDGTCSAHSQAGADCGVGAAWSLCSGDKRVVVAVIDGPVMYSHEDLADNMWTNQAELTGTPGVDDDGNGYVDDIYGYDFALSKGEIDWSAPDEIAHGTHVAGIVAAANGNGKGVSSIAGGDGSPDSGVKLMSCQIFYGSSSGTNDRVVGNAFIYAADNGASVAQCSYGYNGGTYKTDNAYINLWPFEYRGLKYFTDPSNANCPAVESNVAVFAAGNENSSYSSYPGALPICISVTALGPDGLPAAYTNYGLGCNIAAPGGDDNYGTESKILSTGIPEINGLYAYMAGSSMACPHVSGIVALGMSYALSLGKHFSTGGFLSMLYASVNDVDAFLTGGSKTCPDGQVLNLKTYYKRMGTGSIDAWKMMMQVEGTPSIIVRTGEECEVMLHDYFGEGAATMTFIGVEASPEAVSALGIKGTPTVSGGCLKIRCDKRGAAKVRVKAIAGGSIVGGPSGTGGTEISREVSIVSRGVAGANNGWL